MDEIYFNFKSLAEDNTEMHRAIKRLEREPILDPSHLHQDCLYLAE